MSGDGDFAGDLDGDIRRASAHIAQVRAQTSAEKRLMIAIAGPPASGKTTLAGALVDAINNREPADPPVAALLPMDGFHLDNAVLDEMGLRAVKGAPQTFDADGYIALVRSVREATTDILCPGFDRTIDAVVPDDLSIPAGTRIVIAEGNYLLLTADPWHQLKSLFDTTIALTPPLAELERRLIDRWLAHGHDQDAAEKRARGNDLVNAETVLTSSQTADLRLGIA